MKPARAYPQPPLIPVEDVTALPLGPLRWRERKHRHRPLGEPFNVERHGVEVTEEREARPFVEREHYSGTWVAARLSVGLYRCPRAFMPGVLGRAELVGVCVFAVPMQPKTITKYAPGLDPSLGVELSRLVLLDQVEGNAESWFVRRALTLLARAKPEVRVVISYSDPCVRRRLDGSALLPGHTGGIYQALGARYFGRSSAAYKVIGPDGQNVCDRSKNKLANLEVGGNGFYERFLAMGAPRIRPGEGTRAYVERALAEGPFRRFKHPGNHAYGWSRALDAEGVESFYGAGYHAYHEGQSPLLHGLPGPYPRRRGMDGVAQVAGVLPWNLADSLRADLRVSRASAMSL